MADQHQQKEELRQQLLDQRKAISEVEFKRASQQIIQRLRQQTEFEQAKTIHCYVSMNDRREVDTHAFLKEMIEEEKNVVVPVTNFQDGTLTHVALPSFDVLEANKWGVPEPNGGREVSPQKLELVIVPMVAGDERGNRIGYGEGFYDRFLSQVDCPKIGLIFEQNVIDQLPVEDFDVRLDKIITEARVIHHK